MNTIHVYVNGGLVEDIQSDSKHPIKVIVHDADVDAHSEWDFPALPADGKKDWEVELSILHGDIHHVRADSKEEAEEIALETYDIRGLDMREADVEIMEVREAD